VPALPALEVLVGDRAYFIDRDGKRWRVYDATDGHPHRPPLRTATHRLFVAADGARRQYSFQDGDAHILSAATLEHQLRSSTLTRAPTKRRAGWAEQRLRDDS
jgi:hypothetical protein